MVAIGCISYVIPGQATPPGIYCDRKVTQNPLSIHFRSAGENLGGNRPDIFEGTAARIARRSES